MTKLLRCALVVGLTAACAGPAIADVHFDGLYHNNTNLNPQAEQVPEHPGVFFRNLDYANSNVTFYFLTDSPAGDAGDTPGGGLRLWSNREYWEAATKETSVVLQAGVNEFHTTPSAGAVTVDVWKVTWLPSRQFTGWCYYAPFVATTNGGVETDRNYILRSLAANNTGPDCGTNDNYWNSFAQLIGTNFFGDDYAFEWTNWIAYNFDWVYFNNTNLGAPSTENVPGLTATPFFDYHYASNEPSYVYVLGPTSGVDSITARLYFNAGPGDIYREATLYTSVVISSASAFHSTPAVGDATVGIWRAEFWPPSGWSNDLWHAPRVTKPGDGTMWLVKHFEGIGGGSTATNNFNADPQFLFTDGPWDRDWLHQPTTIIWRTGVNLDWAYYSSTNLSPLTEEIPEYDGSTFIKIDYARTTTTFHVLTDTDLPLVPGEIAEVQMRIAWWDPETGEWSNAVPSMGYVTDIVLDAGSPFHGLPAADTHTVALWRLDWEQPLSTFGTPLQSNVTVYYSPLIKSSVIGASGAYQTDWRYLIKRIDGNTTNYWGYNNYTQDEQYYGLDPTGEHDYRYDNNPLDLDWLYFNNTNLMQPQDEDVPGLAGQKFLEYRYGTNEPSYVHALAPVEGISSMVFRFYFSNGGGDMFYDAHPVATTVVSSASPFHGLPAAGDVTLAVWRATFYPPPNWQFDNMWYAPQVTFDNGDSIWMVRSLAGDLYGQADVNNWANDPQYFHTWYGDRDWYYWPTGLSQRSSSMTVDWAYFGNTNAYDPETEPVPNYDGSTFLVPDYDNTTTIFHVLTDKSFALYEGESNRVEVRVTWSTNWADWAPDNYLPATAVTTIVLDAAAKFHGLPLADTHTVTLWRALWNQPTTNGAPITNDIYVFYSPLIASVMGSQAYQTDHAYLLDTITNAAGFGSNNYVVAPQLYGPTPYDYDYYYLHQWTASGYTDGIPDWWWDRYSIPGAQRIATNNPDSDFAWAGPEPVEADNLYEYITDTDPTSDSSVFSNSILAANGFSVLGLQAGPPTTNSRRYDVWWKTNLLEETDWVLYGLDVPGDDNGAAVTLTVTNEAGVRFYRTGVRIP